MDGFERSTRRAALVGGDEERARAILATFRSGRVPDLTVRCEGDPHRDPPGRWTSVSHGYRPPCCGGSGRVALTDQARISIAAHCGDRAARILIPDDPRAFGSPIRDERTCSGCGWDLVHRYGCRDETLEEWAAGFLAWPSEVSLRAALVAAGLGVATTQDLGHRMLVTVMVMAAGEPGREVYDGILDGAERASSNLPAYVGDTALILKHGTGSRHLVPCRLGRVLRSAGRVTNPILIKRKVSEAMVAWALGGVA